MQKLTGAIMDLKEIYLRQMDQNIKRQGELQEENNRILK